MIDMIILNFFQLLNYDNYNSLDHVEHEATATSTPNTGVGGDAGGLSVRLVVMGLLLTVFHWLLAILIIYLIMGSMLLIVLATHLSTCLVIFAWEISFLVLQKWLAPIFEIAVSILECAVDVSDRLSISKSFLSRWSVC